MTTFTEPPRDLRALIARRLAIEPARERHMAWFSGDGATTHFALPAGWRVHAVFVDGALKRSGSGGDYTVADDGFVQTVRLATAPATVDVAVQAARIER